LGGVLGKRVAGYDSLIWKDAVVVFEATGALKSTTPDGKTVVTESRFGDVRFSPRNRTHSEILVHGEAHAVITELK
jgi:hypothetical protein